MWGQVCGSLRQGALLALARFLLVSLAASGALGLPSPAPQLAARVAGDMVTMEELREMDCSVLKRLMNRDENGSGGGSAGSSSGSHGALGLLSGGKCLLLDCRPFLAHSAGYIRGSVNVRCNTIVRRRAKGSVSLEQILPAEEEVRARLRSGLYSAVIVYDERSPRAESLREDSTVSLVVRALRRNAERTDICLLKGKRGRPGRASEVGGKVERDLGLLESPSLRVFVRVRVHGFAVVLQL